MKIQRFGQAEPLSKLEFQQVQRAISSPVWRLVFSLCWYTTERPSAILQLKVENCYLSPVDRTPLKSVVIAARTRKDATTREVPISTALASELKSYQPPLTGWLFPGRNPEKPLTFSAYSKALEKTFRNLGWKGYTTYSTRRGSLTTLARQGFSTRQIQAVSGHSSLASLQRYLEVNPAEVKAAVDTL